MQSAVKKMCLLIWCAVPTSKPLWFASSSGLWLYNYFLQYINGKWLYGSGFKLFGKLTKFWPISKNQCFVSQYQKTTTCRYFRTSDRVFVDHVRRSVVRRELVENWQTHFGLFLHEFPKPIAFADFQLTDFPMNSGFSKMTVLGLCYGVASPTFLFPKC